MATSLTDVHAGATEKTPTHDVKLTDTNGNMAGLILCNRNGKQDPRGMQIAAMPRTPMQMSQGAKGYDDMELPFVAEVQTTWVGGRGQETLSSDRTKFYDSYRIDTTKEYPIAAPAVIAQTGLENALTEYANTSPTTGQYITRIAPVTLSTYKMAATITITGFYLYIINSSGNNTTIYYSTADLGNVTGISDIQAVIAAASYNTAAEQQRSVVVPTGTDGWVYFPTNSTTVDQNHWLGLITLSSAGITTKYQAVTTSGHYTNTDTAWEQYGSPNDTTVLSIKLTDGTENTINLFEYKRALYAVKTTTPKGDSTLYLNGDRGVADSNSTDLSKTVDASKSWTPDEWIGCIVLIINGAGEMEDQPWRRIVSNTETTLTVSSNWKITQGATTEYVILGSNKWTSVATIDTVPETPVECMGKAVTDIAVVNDYVVFAFGSEQYMSCYKVDNNTNVFRERWAISASYGDLICPIVNEEGKLKLWRADVDDCLVDCCTPPAFTVTTMAFNFDINYDARQDLKIQRARLEDDWQIDDALPTEEEQDAGYQLSLQRQMADLSYQIDETTTAVAFGGTPAGTSYNGSFYVSQKYLPMQIKCGNTSSKITNILPYGAPVIPYIMKEDSFGSIFNGIYAEIPLAELKAVRSEVNGKAAMHYGVYLYFNLEGGKIERYYDQRLDDIGFNRDEGLPVARQGEVIKLLPYPGRFYAACDAGFGGLSTVMCNNGLGWHEIYRSGTAGLRITDIHIQAIPGNEYADRLWITEGTSLVALPIAITPVQQYQYNYHGYTATDTDGYIETSWIDFELKDVDKYFHSITVFSDHTGTMNTKNEYDIKVWFRVDGDNDWTNAGTCKAVASTELELNYPYKPGIHNVSGKKIKFKIALNPRTQYYTPRLKAIVVNGVLRMPVKRSWNITFMLEPMKDLNNRPLTDIDTPTSATGLIPNTLYHRLFWWANSETHNTPLLMRTNDPITDNKYVFIDPASISTFQALSILGDGSGNKEYRHLGSLTLYEV